jgi:aspartyl-tRNA(Asn)/glutamyl-tRNA(Gln) amidotransferase subunit B
MLHDGYDVIQETMHYDPRSDRLTPLRSKEEAHDYRYFPEPDLVPLEPGPDWVAAVGDAIPVLPAERRAAIAAAAGIAADSDTVVTVVRLGLDAYLDRVTAGPGDATKRAAIAVRRLANEVAAEIESVGNLDPAAFARLVAMEADGSLTTTQARTVLKDMLESGGQPEEIAARRRFEAMSADDLAGLVDKVIAAHPAEWQRYAAGEDKLTGLFIGKIKAESGGKADLSAVPAILKARRV